MVIAKASYGVYFKTTEEDSTLFYDISIEQRFVGDSRGLSLFRDCIEVDGLGVYMHVNKKEQATPEYARQCLIGIRSNKCLVEADSPEEAIEQFHEKFPGASVGGNGRENKAAWINKNESIIELPDCDRRCFNRTGQLICGSEVGVDGNGEFGGCILEGYSPPSFDCPVDSFYRNLNDLDKADFPKAQIILGYNVIRLLSILKRE